MKWSEYLTEEEIALGLSLASRANEERRRGRSILPEQNEIFRALNLTSPENCKVVIIGQDPYPTKGNANGLAFSVSPGTPFPASLKNIFKEMVADLGCAYPTCGDLTPWAKQGVLLLNTTLTVREGCSNSHKDWGWDKFTAAILRVCAELPQPIVFLSWGGYARAVVSGLHLWDHAQKMNLFSSHPSPLGATKGNEVVPAFIGSRPFSNVNKLLIRLDSEPIDWTLP